MGTELTRSAEPEVRDSTIIHRMLVLSASKQTTSVTKHEVIAPAGRLASGPSLDDVEPCLGTATAGDPRLQDHIVPVALPAC